MWRFLIDEHYRTVLDSDPDFSHFWISCAVVAAEHGSVDVLEILMVNIKTRPPARDFHKVVVAASKGGSARVLQFLIDQEYWTVGLLSQAEQQTALEAAAAHGRVQVLQWWYSKSQLSPALVTFPSKSSLGDLIWAACRHGKVGVLDWLVATFGKQSFMIPSRHLPAVGSKNGTKKAVVEWMLKAAANESICLCPASLEYLQMAL